jgi:glutaredoxin
MKKILALVIFVLSSLTLYAEGSAEVTIYTMPGCGRCGYTLNYLKTNNIPYTEYSTADKEGNMKMWRALSDSGKFAGGGISMPVVVINGQTYFNIPDLKGFAESIPSLLAAGGGIKPAEEKDEPALDDKETEKEISEKMQTMEFFENNKKFSYSTESGNSLTSGTATVKRISGNEVSLDVLSSKKVLINGKYRFGQAPVKSVFTLILEDGVFKYNSPSEITYTGKVDNTVKRLTMKPDSGDEGSFNLDVKQ